EKWAPVFGQDHAHMKNPMSAEPADPPAHVAFQVFLDGIVAAVRSVFFYVLIGNYVGMGALAHEVGFSFWWMALSTVLIWAAPAAQKIGLDLMWTGLIAGTMAYGVHRLREARRKRVS